MTVQGVVSPPRGLLGAGTALWLAVTESHGLRADELLVLESACRTADTIGRLDEALDGAPLTVAGSMGQLREHPLLSEVRQQRAALARLLRQLELPNPQAAGRETSNVRSMHGRALARARWSA